MGTADPARFWGGWLRALEAGQPAVAIDPSWPPAWRQQLETTALEAPQQGNFLLMPTGGTSGMPRFCIHNADTLIAAADAYAHRFGQRGIVHSVVVLPPFHVGGLMPVIRSARCGGAVHFADLRNPGSLLGAGFAHGQASLSLVPTQLRRFISNPETRAILQRFGLILVGGAGCDPALLQSARHHRLRLAPCYGSTETAAMVTALDPDDFLQGADGVGTAMPHARIQLGADGRVSIHSDSNLLGYLPEVDGFRRDPFTTGDMGHLDQRGGLHILGRADRVIVSGGKKIHPECVERAALETGQVEDAHCLPAPDPEWGQRIELEIVSANLQTNDLEAFKDSLRENLPAWAIPKVIRILARNPRTEAGKWRSSGQRQEEQSGN